MLYQLSYARTVRKSTGRWGESKLAQASIGQENERGTGPLGPPSPALAIGPLGGAYGLKTAYVYPSTCWSELNTAWKGVLASLRPVLT